MLKSNADSERIFSASYDLSNYDTYRDLKAYFGNVVKGQDHVYTAPFAKGEETQDILDAWEKVLKSIEDRWPSLYAFEIDLAKKVGPMSIRKPLAQRLDDIESYYGGILLPSTEVSSKAIAATIAEFSHVRGMGIRGQRRTVELMKKSTNSGSPFFRKRRLVVNETVPAVVGTYRQECFQNLHNVEWGAVASLGWRGQEGGYSKADVKQRVVWMFPFGVNVAELQFYQPAIEQIQKYKLVPAWVSMDEVDRRVTAMFDTKAESDLVVCTDFSKFDQHFNAEMQSAAKAVIDAMLNTASESRVWMDEVFPIKYSIPLAINWNTVITGSHGMGSGSGGTNFDETMAHRCLQYEAAQLSGSRLNPNSQCLGDDGVLTYPGITVEDVVNAYKSHGMDMNLEKQYASTQDCVYLRRWHHKNYRIDGICAGVYSTCRAIGRLRYLERRMDPKKGWGPKAVALRQLSIIENCKYHPLKEQFVDFCMKRDKYKLGILIPGFLDNIELEAKKLIDYMPDFLGYTKTLQSSGDPVGGIKSWWIVKYLKSLA